MFDWEGLRNTCTSGKSISSAGFSLSARPTLLRARARAPMMIDVVVPQYFTWPQLQTHLYELAWSSVKGGPGPGFLLGPL